MAASPRMLVDGIEIVDYRKLRIERLLGQGALGQVHVAHCSHPSVTNPVVIKRMNQPVNDKVKKLFMKEAKLLSQLHHENVIRMYGICEGPLVIILEYVFFDFKPFLNRKIEVNSVDKFLFEISKLPTLVAERLDHLIPAIASDITRGLSYLHNLEIAHRDLKPLNVLISNQHYCDLEDNQETERLKSVRPVICKLADFGESRSQMIQTNRINDPSTNQGWRGTISFMAPEILLPEGLDRGRKLSLEDLKKVDIWALGLVFYRLVNPSVSFPYEREADRLEDLMMLHRQRTLPSADPVYQPKHATVWSCVHDAFQFCTKYNPSERPNTFQVLAVFCAHRPASRHATDEMHPKRQKSPERSHRLLIPAHTPAFQWYAGEEAVAALKQFLDEVTQIADGKVTMSRDTITKDLTMSFKYHGQEWEVNFPCNFPGSKASLTRDGEERDQIGGETVEFALRSLICLLTGQVRMNQSGASRSHSQKAETQPHQWHAGDRGDKELQFEYCVQEAESPSTQWYSGKSGVKDLQFVLQAFQEIAHPAQVEMFRDNSLQNISMVFTNQRYGKKWEVTFPPGFPRQGALMIETRQSRTHGTERKEHRMPGSDRLQKAVDRMIRFITIKRATEPNQWHAGDGGDKELQFEYCVQEAESPSTQWYSGESGVKALQFVLQAFQEIAHPAQVEMFRDASLQNISMSFTNQRYGKKWEVTFPPGFPRQGALMIETRQSRTHGTERKEHRMPGSDRLQKAVDRMIRFITTNRATEPNQWHAGDGGDKELQFEYCVQEAETPSNQWYSSESGVKDLQFVLQAFQEIAHPAQVEMFRDTSLQNISMSFTNQRYGKKWEVTFPPGFPRQGALMIETRQSRTHGTERREHRMPGSDRLQNAVDRMISFIKTNRD